MTHRRRVPRLRHPSVLPAVMRAVGFRTCLACPLRCCLPARWRLVAPLFWCAVSLGAATRDNAMLTRLGGATRVLIAVGAAVSMALVIARTVSAHDSGFGLA